MCGENQKTLKFSIKKRERGREVLGSDTPGSSPAEVPGSSQCLRSEVWSWQDDLEERQVPSPPRIPALAWKWP